jgi:cell division septation protein DedD
MSGAVQRRLAVALIVVGLGLAATGAVGLIGAPGGADPVAATAPAPDAAPATTGAVEPTTVPPTTTMPPTSTTMPATSTTVPAPTTTTTAPPATTSVAAPATSTTAAPVTTAVAAPALVAAFIERFASAIAAGDVDALVATLHPAVVETYGESVCRSFTEREILALGDYRLVGDVTGPYEKSLDTPQGPLPVAGIYEAAVRFTFQGSDFDVTAEFVVADTVSWLAVCR